MVVYGRLWCMMVCAAAVVGGVREANCIVMRHDEIVLSQRTTFVQKDHWVKAGVRWCMVVFGGVRSKMEA